MEGEGGLLVFLTKLIDLCLFQDIVVSPRWNILSSSTRDVCNAQWPEKRDKTGFSLHYDKLLSWPIYASDTEVPGQYQLKPRSMWPVLGALKASTHSSSYKALYGVLQTSTHAGRAQNPFI